jgi:hypothetical protein
MTTATLRKELKGYIAKMPEYRLEVIKPLLSELAEPLYTIEPATPEETKKANKRIREYYKDPSSFVPFKKRVVK